MASAPFELRADDGWTLRGDVLSTEGAPRAVAVLAHAMMVTRRTFASARAFDASATPLGETSRVEGLAGALVRRGICVLNADLRGHGDSGPLADAGAIYTYDDFVMRDLPALVAEARTRFPGLPVALVGHSLGAHAGAIAAGLDSSRAPDALVSIAGNLWIPRLDPSRARRLVKRAIFKGWLALAERKGYFDAGALRLGNNPEPLAYIRQFVAMYEANRLTSADGSIDYEAALARASLPILSIASEGDRVLAHPACVERFFALARRAQVESRRVLHFDFQGRAPSHMGLVTDARSRPLWNEIATWILTKTRSAGSTN